MADVTYFGSLDFHFLFGASSRFFKAYLKVIANVLASGFSLLENRYDVTKNLTFFGKKVKENRGNTPQKVTQMS